MTNERAERVVLMDTDGNYYLFTRDMLDHARVPAEYAAEMRADLDKHTEGSDVSGFSLQVTTQAVGEEAGGGLPTLTTLALGEEGGPGRPGPIATTQALGEEAGGGQITLPSKPPWFR